MKTTIALFAALTLVHLALPLAAAGPCDGSVPATGIFDAGVSGTDVYVVTNGDGSVQVYQESNGLDGLQRGGTDAAGLTDCSPGDGVSPPDTMLV